MPCLHVLSDAEANRFDQPPAFNQVQRKKYFAITETVRKLIQPLRKLYTQVGFVLQWGYFRYTTRFFSVDRFQDDDTRYIIQLLSGDLSVSNFRAAYESSIVYYHRTIILGELGYHAQWTIRATAFQLQQISDLYMQYLHLLSFIHFQFYTYQDGLIEVIKSSVQSSLNQAEKEQKERYFASRRAKNRAIRSVTCSRRRYKERWEEAKEIIQSKELADDEKIILLQQLIDAEADRRPGEQDDDLRIDQDAEALEKEISPVTQQREYYDIVGHRDADGILKWSAVSLLGGCFTLMCLSNSSFFSLTIFYTFHCAIMICFLCFYSVFKGLVYPYGFVLVE